MQIGISLILISVHLSYTYCVYLTLTIHINSVDRLFYVCSLERELRMQGCGHCKVYGPGGHVYVHVQLKVCKATSRVCRTSGV
ncbi:uncharacterized protein EDB93DRAFT_1168486 [Suillus bovinus]|uniref:uncharacterized protein n=1 Tax=Suillus bovinus TaxID=48563 RepID=UPI001B886EAD|nr:uncharacterized protein EDB93DRAFT_1168486 [Suillus bovinus]KAG2136591.1 hypothetical protein EDB93DRAFT_1168486 [Suillus bovinus]